MVRICSILLVLSGVHALRVREPEGAMSSTVASLVPDNALVCYQGDAEFIPKMHAALKLSVNGGLYNKPANVSVQNVSCTSLGFSELKDGPDDCWAPAQKWIKPGADTMPWVLAQQANWATYEQINHFQSGTGKTAAGCTCMPGYRSPDVGLNERGVGVQNETNTFCNTTLTSPELKTKLQELSTMGVPSEATAKDVNIFIPEAGTVCFEGIYMAMMAYISTDRANPLATITSHSAVQYNTSCEQSGFTKLVSSHDSCWNGCSMWTKDTADVNQTLAEFRARNRKEVHAYADRRGIDHDFAMQWATCQGGCSGGPQTGFRWWGADRIWNKSECEDFVKHELMPTLRAAAPKVGSFVADGGGMCWEGSFDYMEQILSSTQLTPVGEMMFHDARVMEATCTELGYEKVQDPRDECWPEASKMIRQHGGWLDLQRWSLGDTGYAPKMATSDERHKYPEGTSLELATCNCQWGGANRDRGMLVTQSAVDVDDSFTDKYCTKLYKKYKIKTPKGGKKKRSKGKTSK